MAVSVLPDKGPTKALVVEVKWFWVSIQMDICASEKLYLFKEVRVVDASIDRLFLSILLKFI